ncbi:unnamed protein product [Protopolystoma xenopodis]|uniref:Uncharacterized protein n=1 Tax=Protopolystoma xenopodis TaxID=117903 RepID=A0A448X7X4_9PLAT|nr:unnamed protein product [Protopolystoma xenopodis]
MRQPPGLEKSMGGIDGDYRAKWGRELVGGIGIAGEMTLPNAGHPPEDRLVKVWGSSWSDLAKFGISVRRL